MAGTHLPNETGSTASDCSPPEEPASTEWRSPPALALAEFGITIACGSWSSLTKFASQDRLH